MLKLKPEKELTDVDTLDLDLNLNYDNKPYGAGTFFYDAFEEESNKYRKYFIGEFTVPCTHIENLYFRPTFTGENYVERFKSGDCEYWLGMTNPLGAELFMSVYTQTNCQGEIGLEVWLYEKGLHFEDDDWADAQAGKFEQAEKDLEFLPLVENCLDICTDYIFEKLK
jgi:hypothetical protein